MKGNLHIAEPRGLLKKQQITPNRDLKHFWGGIESRYIFCLPVFCWEFYPDLLSVQTAYPKALVAPTLCSYLPHLFFFLTTEMESAV